MDLCRFLTSRGNSSVWTLNSKLSSISQREVFFSITSHTNFHPSKDFRQALWIKKGRQEVELLNHRERNALEENKQVDRTLIYFSLSNNVWKLQPFASKFIIWKASRGAMHAQENYAPKRYGQTPKTLEGWWLVSNRVSWKVFRVQPTVMTQSSVLSLVVKPFLREWLKVKSPSCFGGQ